MLELVKNWITQKASRSFIIHEGIEECLLPIDALLNRKIDGFIMRQALSTAICTAIKTETCFLKDEDCMVLPNGEGRVYPYPYSMITKEATQDAYFKKAAQSANFLPKGEALVKQQLRPLTSRPFEILKDLEGRAFSPINFRMLNERSKGLTIHCENSFLHQLTPSFRESLLSKVALHDQLSFLFVIDKPECSGNIVLYNREWDYFKVQPEKFSDEMKKDDGLSFFTKNGQTNVEAREIELGAGDLFIFRAGQIWHRVKDIGHNGNRLTCGGFIARGIIEDKVYFWS